MPTIDRGVVLNARIATLPCIAGHCLDDFASTVFGSGLRRIGDPMSHPIGVFLDRCDEVVCNTDRKIGILKHDRTIGFAIEIRFVATLVNQHPGFVFFLGFTFDEFHNIRVPDFQRLHLGRASRLAAAFHHGCNLIVNPHEGERP